MKCRDIACKTVRQDTLHNVSNPVSCEVPLQLAVEPSIVSQKYVLRKVVVC